MKIEATAEPQLETEDEFARFLQSGVAQTSADGERQHKTLKAWVDLAETYRIVQVLRECHGNRSAAARALGIGRRTLYTKMEKLGLVPSWGVARP